MTVIRDISLALEVEHVLRRQGTVSDAIVQSMVSKIQEMLTDAMDFITPIVAYQQYTVTGLDRNRIYLTDGSINIRALKKSFAQMRDIAVVVGTIGPALEDRVTEYFHRGERFRGLVLDGIGSAAVDLLSQQVCEIVRAEAESRGFQTSSPISPGMPGLSIKEQGNLFRLVETEAIGVYLTKVLEMTPRKSVSMVIAIGENMPRWSASAVCSLCRMRDTCTHKIPVGKVSISGGPGIL